MRAMAARARDTVFIGWHFTLFGADGKPASMAKLIVANFKAVPNTDTLIKNEAFAIPEAIFVWDFLKIFEDTPFQMKDVINATNTERESLTTLCIPDIQFFSKVGHNSFFTVFTNRSVPCKTLPHFSR